MAFETQFTIRFAHVDPAGIVFYPRYYEMLSAATEDWCAGALGVDFATMHRLWRRGVPSVKIDANFTAVSELGDVLTIRVLPTRIGSRSCTLQVDFLCEGERRADFRLVVVWMDLDTRRAAPWPDSIRAIIERAIEEG